MNRKQKVTTLFSLGAVGIILLVSILVLVKNNVFKSKNYYYTRIQTAKGLSGHPPVYFKGYTVGQMSSFELSEDLSIKASFFIFKEYEDLMFKYTLIEKNINILTGQITDFRLVLPNVDNRKDMKEGDNYVAEIDSEEARQLVNRGIIRNTRGGIAGIVSKVNIFLDNLDKENTPEKVSKLLVLTNSLLGEGKRTIASYNAIEVPEARDKVMLMMKKANSGIDSVNKSLDYLKGILKTLHNNKNEITPILLKTNQTLDDASDTLEGINNNPLIRGGIRKNNRDIQLEIFD